MSNQRGGRLVGRRVVLGVDHVRGGQDEHRRHVEVAEGDVAEGDRIFESHVKWMTGHPREGDTALLSYRISKGP